MDNELALIHATDPNSFPIIGTVSWGTLRTVDLVDRFASALRDVLEFRRRRGVDHDTDAKLYKLAKEVDELPDDFDFDSEDALYILEDLFDALDSVAPRGTYFGATDGDGSDFGFWTIDDADDADDDGCPFDDPDCMGDNGDCHDACERPAD